MLKAHILDNFKNLLEYQSWVRQSFDALSMNKDHKERFHQYNVEARIQLNSLWYGEGATFEEMNKGITEYKSPELIDKIYSQVNDRISTAVRDKIKARKVKYNPQGLGVFVYDRAAMGIYRLKEFYSPSLQKKVEREEARQSKSGFELIKDGSTVLERWEQKPDGKPKIRTTSKNVYAFFPQVSKEKQAVEMYISCGGHAKISAVQFLYSGMSAIIIAQLLEKARIQTRISIVIGSSPDNFKQNVYAAIIPVKNYDQPLDINLLALLTSDPRFFRFEGFKGIISLYEHFQAIAPGDLGRGLERDTLTRTIEQSNYTKTAKLAPNRFYFGWTFSETEAVREVNEVIEEIATKLEKK